MRQHHKRWAIEVGVLVALLILGLALDSSRTCASPQFGLPANCDPLYVTIALLLVAAVVFVEVALAIKRRVT